MKSIFLIPLFFMSICGPQGSLRVADFKSGPRGTLGIGYIENRDYRYTPHNTGNFKNMLEYELAELGYRTTLIKQEHLDGLNAPETSPNSKNQNRENEQANVKMSPGRDTDEELTRDLLPPTLKNVAGEKGLVQIRNSDEPHRIGPLDGEKIKLLAAKHKFDFYIQGAFGDNQTGPFLETRENVFIFLEVYNSQGAKVGIINFRVEDRSLREADFLKNVCERIARGFGDKISGFVSTK